MNTIPHAGQSALQAADYHQYEVSAFAAVDRECRHNLNYWQFGDYLAVGAGAHGKHTDDQGVVRRYEKPAHPQTYIEQGVRGQIEDKAQVRANDDITFEYMLNILRLPQGFTEQEFGRRSGQPLEAISGNLAIAQTDGLLVCDDRGSWRPTDLGMRFLNDLQARFLPLDRTEQGKTDQELLSRGAAFQ